MKLSQILITVAAFSLKNINAYFNYPALLPCGEGATIDCLGSFPGHPDGTYSVEGDSEFGLAFQAEGTEWTMALCQMDHFGDGSNGISFGDPDCEAAVDYTGGETEETSEPTTEETSEPTVEETSEPYAPECERRMRQ